MQPDVNICSLDAQERLNSRAFAYEFVVVKVYCQSSITVIHSFLLCTGNTNITEQQNTSSDVVPHHSDVLAVATVQPSVSEVHDSGALTNVGVGQSWKESAPCVDNVSMLSSAIPVMGAKSLAAAAVGVSASGINTMTLSGTEGTGVAGIVPFSSKPVIRLAAPRFKVASADVVTRLILRAPNLAHGSASTIPVQGPKPVPQPVVVRTSAGKSIVRFH
jgi:hypothetical protein